MTDDELKLRESGLGGSTVPEVGVLPPNQGQWVVPSFETFIGVVNLHTRTHRWSFDEAMKVNPSVAIAMESDLVLEEALSSRFRPVSQLSWSLVEEDETDPKQVEAKQFISKIIDRIPNFQALKFSLLRASWYGRMGASILYQWGTVDNKSALVVKDHRPVNGDKLTFRYSGDVGILVGSQYKGDTVSAADGRYQAHFLTATERESFIVHRYERRDRGFLEYDMSGAIEGSGIRDRVYHYWAMKASFLANLTDFADRFSNGVWEAFYDQSNPQSKTEVESALAAYRTNRLLLWPRDRDGKTPYGLNIKEVGTQNPAFLLNLIEGYFDKYLRLFILGRSAALDSQSLGGDEVGLAETSLAVNERWDAVNLDETLTSDLVAVLYRWNCPGVPPARFKSDVDTPNAPEELKNAEIMKGLGMDINAEHLYAVAGMPKPEPGGLVASGTQPLSPTAVTGTPQGVPVTGQPGPIPQDSQAPQPDISSQPPQPNILDA